MAFSTIGFVGLGLIGGSIAKKLKQQNSSITIIAYDLNQDALAMAQSEGIIDVISTKLDHHFANCNYIFLCAPVQYNIVALTTLKDIVSPDCIFTDVGSVKSNIHDAVLQMDLEDRFIGGHPMAGSEQSGYAHAKSHLFENAYYAITKTTKTTQVQLDSLTDLVKLLGAIPILLDYKEHDYIVGAISHLPHVISACLVNLVANSDSKEATMKQIAAGGFKDITRISSSSPEMWQQICLTNGKNISLLLEQYIKSLQQFKSEIDQSNSNELFQLFSDSREYRNSFSDIPSGPIKKPFVVYCDLIDETGAISTLATILSSNGISIKNIGIIHNREFEEGALKIEFYEQEQADKAVDLLQKYRYTVFKH